MKKTILTAVVVALAATANAGSIQKSANGSSNILGGTLALPLTSIAVVLDNGSKAVASTASTLWGSSKAVGHASVFVIENPSEASSMARDGIKNGLVFALTTSGQIVQWGIDGSVAFVQHPITSTSNAVKASGNGISKAYNVTVDSLGRLVTASGEFLVDASGAPVKLVLDGSGEVYQVAEGSVVAVYNGSVSTIQFVGETLGDSVATSAAASKTSASELSKLNIKEAILAILEMPAEAFENSTAVGYQNDFAK